MPRYRISTRRSRRPVSPAAPKRASLRTLRLAVSRLSVLAAAATAAFLAAPGCTQLLSEGPDDVMDVPATAARPASTSPTMSDVGPALNNAPFADAGPDQVVSRGQIVELDAGGSSDPDGDRLKFRWTQVSGPPVVFGDEEDGKVVFAAPYTPGTLVFGLTVQDKFSLPATDFVTITVTAPPVTSRDEHIARQ